MTEQSKPTSFNVEITQRATVVLDEVPTDDSELYDAIEQGFFDLYDRHSSSECKVVGLGWKPGTEDTLFKDTLIKNIDTDIKVNILYYNPEFGRELVYFKKEDLKKGHLVCSHVWAGTNYDNNLTQKQTRFVYGSHEFNIAMTYALKQIEGKRDCSIDLAPRT